MELKTNDGKFCFRIDYIRAEKHSRCKIGQSQINYKCYILKASENFRSNQLNSRGKTNSFMWARVFIFLSLAGMFWFWVLAESLACEVRAPLGKEELAKCSVILQDTGDRLETWGASKRKCSSTQSIAEVWDTRGIWGTWPKASRRQSEISGSHVEVAQLKHSVRLTFVDSVVLSSNVGRRLESLAEDVWRA